MSFFMAFLAVFSRFLAFYGVFHGVLNTNQRMILISNFLKQIEIRFVLDKICFRKLSYSSNGIVYVLILLELLNKDSFL